VYRKHKSSTPIPEAKTKKSMQTSTAIASCSLIDSDEDNKEAVRTSLVVKFPDKNKQKSSVIVIDDSDSNSSVIYDDVKPTLVVDQLSVRNEHTSENAKIPNTSDRSMTSQAGASENDVSLDDKPPPNLWPPGTETVTRQSTSSVAELNRSKRGIQSSERAKRMAEKSKSSNTFFSINKQMATKPCSSIRASAQDNVAKIVSEPQDDTASQSLLDSTLLTPTKNVAGRSSHKKSRKRLMHRALRSPEVTSTTRINRTNGHCDVAAQTDNDNVYETLNNLRTNVLKLLKTIVPTLDDFGNLEFVDSVVVEMVRVSDTADANHHSDIKQDDTDN